MILDNLSSIMSKVRCAALEFEPSTEEMFSLASKFILGRQLRCVTLHLSDSESSRYKIRILRRFSQSSQLFIRLMTLFCFSSPKSGLIVCIHGIFRNFALQVVRQLGTPAVCLNLTAGIFDYGKFHELHV